MFQPLGKALAEEACPKDRLLGIGSISSIGPSSAISAVLQRIE